MGRYLASMVDASQLIFHPGLGSLHAIVFRATHSTPLVLCAKKLCLTAVRSSASVFGDVAQRCGLQMQRSFLAVGSGLINTRDQNEWMRAKLPTSTGVKK